MCPAPVTIATMLLLSALTVSTVYFEGINFRGMTVRKDFRRLFLHGMAAFLQHACDIKFVGYKCSRYMCFISENREHFYTLEIYPLYGIHVIACFVMSDVIQCSMVGVSMSSTFIASIVIITAAIMHVLDSVSCA